MYTYALSCQQDGPPKISYIATILVTLDLDNIVKVDHLQSITVLHMLHFKLN